MDSTEIAIGAGAAVLLFWAVGAYNRLVRLRNLLVRAFAPVDEQFKLRQGLLQNLCDTLDEPPGDCEPQVLEALRAACLQADSAHARARAHPGSTKWISSLRMAEEILADTRTRVSADTAGQATKGAALGEITTQLAASDATLAFARRQFNDAVETYNHAVRQFPTWLIAGLFSFRTAATL